MWQRRTLKAVFLVVSLLAAATWPAAGLSGQRPATAPVRKKDLDAEAEKLAKAWTDRFGEGYITQTDSRRHIVYVSAVDEKAFARVTSLLGAYHDMQRKLLFPEPLRWNVTVVLPTLKDYRKLIPHAKAHGIYSARNRTLVSISFSNVLVHEFTHALHHNDQAAANQKHPVWIVEGLATLFQAVRVKDGRMEIPIDAGLTILQKAVKNKKSHPLAELCSMKPEEFMQNADLCYRQVRYVMLYLHRVEKLQQFYQAYKTTYASDQTGVKALEETLGKPLDKIESDWKKWLLAQEPPWRPARKHRAHLGVRMKQTPTGVKIIGFVRNSSAQRAGLLKVGDTIISLSGQTIQTPNALTAAVQSCSPGQIVEIEVVRGGRTTVIKHLLGLMPK
ncbi:MAG: PDZ domain-containing protein [Planctomycetota bacterium]|nr:PDZ domain-containing protein [Planctomycetota bacterium]